MTANSWQEAVKIRPVPARQKMRRPAISNLIASRYQVTIVARSVQDVIESAGGWLCDRIMNGWVVDCLHIDDLGKSPEALLPLRILGYCAPLPESGDLPPVRNRAPKQTIAIAADVVRNDAKACALVDRALTVGDIEVIFWGDVPDNMRSDNLIASPYRMSSAARAFKAHAMHAVSNPIGDIPMVEALLSNKTSTLAQRLNDAEATSPRSS